VATVIWGTGSSISIVRGNGIGAEKLAVCDDIVVVGTNLVRQTSFLSGAESWAVLCNGDQISGDDAAAVDTSMKWSSTGWRWLG
jgi:hypothetical protein